MLKKVCESETFRDGKFTQVLLLSFSFMFVFTAFQTTGIIEVRILIRITHITQKLCTKIIRMSLYISSIISLIGLRPCQINSD